MHKAAVRTEGFDLAKNLAAFSIMLLPSSYGFLISLLFFQNRLYLLFNYGCGFDIHMGDKVHKNPINPHQEIMS